MFCEKDSKWDMFSQIKIILPLKTLLIILFFSQDKKIWDILILERSVFTIKYVK